MKNLRDFFIFCSGSELNVLKRTPTEINKYAGIGATIFFTGVLASIAASYAIYTVFGSYPMAIFFGLVWGLMIFNLDRYIVSSMKHKGSFFNRFTSALPRLALAIIIAMVIAKPLELKIFESEIEAELVTMELEKYKEQEDKMRMRYEADITSLEGELAAMQSQLDNKAAMRDQLDSEAIKEADGTGGSQRRNMGPIYRVKKQDADKAQQELDALYASLSPVMENKTTQLEAIKAKQATALEEMKKVPLDGFAARLDALGRLSDKSDTILWASIFIMLLFIAIETAPVFVKLISDRSPYDYVLDKVEHKYEMNHKSITETLALNTHIDLDYKRKTGTHKNRESITAENELYSHAIKTEVEKLKEKQTGLWDLIKGRSFFGLNNS